MNSPPALSVIMPVRNERDRIEASLDAVLAQDYRGPLEVIVADGSSDDGTREILDRRASRNGRIRVVENPDRIVPSGLNRALAVASGPLVLRVDGHCEPAVDYASRCAAAMHDEEAACVGGVLHTVGQTPVARAIALAQSSPVGVGGARFRIGADRRTEVDSVAFGVCRLDHLLALGGFDEDLLRNQDDELNLRIRQNGGRILLEPAATATYHSRTTLRGLVRQYWQYGWFKPLVVAKRGQRVNLRSLVPPAFVAGLVLASVALGVLATPIAALAPAGAYATAVVITGIWLGRRDRPALLAVPAALAALHLPYGAGYLFGWLRWRRAGPTPVRVADG